MNNTNKGSSNKGISRGYSQKRTIKTNRSNTSQRSNFNNKIKRSENGEYGDKFTRSGRIESEPGRLKRWNQQPFTSPRLSPDWEGKRQSSYSTEEKKNKRWSDSGKKFDNKRSDYFEKPKSSINTDKPNRFISKKTNAFTSPRRSPDWEGKRQSSYSTEEKKNKRWSDSGKKFDNKRSDYFEKPKSSINTDKPNRFISKKTNIPSKQYNKTTLSLARPKFDGKLDINFDPKKKEMVRISLKLSDLGICSRREAELLIADEKIQVNGKTILDPSLLVGYEDRISVDGKMIQNKKLPLKIFLFFKPRGYVVTNKDPEGRPTIFDIIPKKLGRLISVGRLDLNSEGLMILTNNGEYARAWELPASNIRREYRVRVFGKLPPIEEFEKLKNGITIDGVKYGKMLISKEKDTNDAKNCWLSITIFEGKNREIRNVMESFDLQVSKLVRVSYGKYRLGSMLPGSIIDVSPAPKIKVNPKIKLGYRASKDYLKEEKPI